MTGETMRVGVTSAGTLLACPRRVELDQAPREADPEVTVVSAPATLGDICHAALERLVESRSLLGAGSEEEVEGAWVQAAAEISSRHPGLDPSDLPSHDLFRARTSVVAGRLREMLAPLGPAVELTCEAPMQALEGRLRGKPDLIARAPAGHWIIDYKTGAVLDGATELPRSAYRSQLRLYAVLEHQRSGHWPDRAFLLSFTEGTVEVAIEPEECTALADSLLAALEAFDSRRPEPQPACPGPETCRWCRHALRCEAVWAECGEDWAPGVLLAEGIVAQAARTATGVSTIVVDLVGGTLGGSRSAIRAASATPLPELAAGMRIRASGLVRRGGQTFELGPAGMIAEVEA
jgi:RecB family exonuclease